MRHPARIGYLMVLPAVLVFGLYLAYPLLHTILLSAYSWSPIDPRMIYRGGANYAELFRDPNLWVALRNNAYFIILSLVIQMPLALFLAVALNSSARRHRLLRTLIFAPFVLPVVAVALAWQLIYEPNFGALNTLLEATGLHHWAIGWLGEEHTAIFAVIAVTCWRYVGFHMMILLAGLQAVPDELYEAAQLDGAGAWQVFTRITLPALRRVLLVDALLVTVGSVKMFDLVQVMTGGGPGYASDVLATFMYRSAFTNDRMGYSAAIAVIILALTLLLTVLYLRASREDSDSLGGIHWSRLLFGSLGVTLLALLAARYWALPRELVQTLALLGGSLAGLLALWPLIAGACLLADRLPRALAATLRDAGVLVFALIFVIPVLWSLLSAVKPQNELLLSPWALPQEWAWGNFAAALRGGVGLFLLNSFLITTLSVLLMLALALPAAYALARLRLRAGWLIFGVILAGLLVPQHAALLPLYQVNHALGLRGFLSLLGPYLAFCLPLSVLLLKAYFEALPEELSEAALLDGAGHLRILWSIFLPLARPALATVAVFQAAWVWNELPFAMVFLTEKAHMTLTVGLLTFRGEHSTDWAIVMAGVALSILPVLVLYFIFQRHIVKGLTAGAVR